LSLSAHDFVGLVESQRQLDRIPFQPARLRSQVAHSAKYSSSHPIAWCSKYTSDRTKKPTPVDLQTIEPIARLNGQFEPQRSMRQNAFGVIVM
jgi:hypothetical protein